MYPDLTTTYNHAQITLPSRVYPSFIKGQKNHDALLSYLLARLNTDKTNRAIRISRYAKIDREVSTWQQLSKADSERAAKQESTGQAQAIMINLPIQHTHMDDMVSFFAGVYAPNAGSFYEEPNTDKNDTDRRLEAIKTMNADAKRGKYYKNLCRTLRALFKYNLGGFYPEWVVDSDKASGEPGKGYNVIRSLDMYNFLYDPSIDDPSDIPEKAEWAAFVERWNRIQVVRAEQNGEFFGAGDVVNEQRASNGQTADFYCYPPNHAGLNQDGQDGRTVKAPRADWAAYGVSLEGETGQILLDGGHEVITMYCWLNPSEFKISIPEVNMREHANQYMLFKFRILDTKRVVSIEPVNVTADNPRSDVRIPFFLGYLNQDDMGAAQRSIAELLRPFQAYGSFLLNAHVASSRGAIWGLQAYDPDMFDMAAIEPGETVARIKSKAPGRDVRSGLMTINGKTDDGKAMDDLAKLLALVDKFFPGQALPSQIAGMDRAIQSQVAAVLQGVNRRLHMLVRVLDEDILGPTRYEQVMNMMDNGVGDFTGLTRAEITSMIGSGLAQLNREAAAQAMQQLLFAILQNPKSAEQYDVIGIMNFWSRLMNIDADLNKFRLQQQPSPQQAPSQPSQQMVAPANGG